MRGRGPGGSSRPPEPAAPISDLFSHGPPAGPRRLAAKYWVAVADKLEGPYKVHGIVTDNIKLRVNAKNILDETYYTSLYQSAVPFVAQAAGRAVYISAEVKL